MQPRAAGARPREAGGLVIRRGAGGRNAEAGTLDEAARLTAIASRRREVDEQPLGAGPPTIEKQLCPMLPDRMAERIVDLLKISVKNSGDDPEWTRWEGMGRELSRSLPARKHPGPQFEPVSGFRSSL